jgi:hypothetical protein
MGGKPRGERVGSRSIARRRQFELQNGRASTDDKLKLCYPLLSAFLSRESMVLNVTRKRVEVFERGDEAELGGIEH